MVDVLAGYDLSGQVAVLTGAGSGIGKASALTLAAAGAIIVGGDINEAAAQATADEIRDSGGIASAVRTDVTSRAGRCADRWCRRLPWTYRHHGEHRRYSAQQNGRRSNR